MGNGPQKHSYFLGTLAGHGREGSEPRKNSSNPTLVVPVHTQHIQAPTLQWAPGAEIVMKDAIASNVASFEIGFQGCLFGMSVTKISFGTKKLRRKSEALIFY